MTEVKEDIAERVSSHVQHQLEKNDQKQAEAERQAHSGHLKGPAAWMAGGLGLLIIAASAWHGWDSTRPPGFVRLMDPTEKMVNGKPVLTGKVRSTKRRLVREHAWVVTYTDVASQPPKTVLETPLVVHDLKPGETSEWALEIPGWREGLKRTIRVRQ